MCRIFITLLFIFCATYQGTTTRTLQNFNVVNKLFTSSIYQELSKSSEKNKNIFFSPLSAEIILTLLQTGAKNETAAEIQKLLPLPQCQTSIIKKVLQWIKTNSNYTLQTANKIYIENGVRVRGNYKKKANNDFQADLENINFSHSIPAAETMNKWVEQQTGGKIKNLIDPENMDYNIRAILINTLYFKASWVYPFSKYMTGKKKFHKTHTDTIEIDSMVLKFSEDPFSYGENNELDAKILELPIINDASLVIILPNQKNGITKLDKNIEKVLEPQILEKKYVVIQLPKFRLETENNLKDTLQKLGISKIFSPGLADLSGIAGSKGQLYISQIVQKAFLDINENGIEATAATYGGISTYSMPPTPTHTFIADHPFVFYIKVKDVIIFVGKLVNPMY